MSIFVTARDGRPDSGRLRSAVNRAHRGRRNQLGPCIAVLLVFFTAVHTVWGGQPFSPRVRILESDDFDYPIFQPLDLVLWKQGTEPLRSSSDWPPLPLEFADGMIRIPDLLAARGTLASDFSSGRFFLVEATTELLVEVGPTGVTQHDLHFPSARGLAVDPVGERIFVVFGDPLTLATVKLEGAVTLRSEAATYRPINMSWKASANPLAGLAFHKGEGQLYSLLPSEERLVTVTLGGDALPADFLPGIGLADLAFMYFASSIDATDDPAEHRLYLVQEVIDVQVVEIDFTPPAILDLPAPLAPATLIRTTDTSVFSPPSPDPAGIVYMPAADLLLMSDSEVNEVPSIYAGANIFEALTDGTQLGISDTTSFSSEPTGVAYDPATDVLFVTDDDQKRIFEIHPGADAVHFTADDNISSFDVRAFDSRDPEGIAFDPNTGDIVIVDGVNEEVYRLSSGANGTFDGVPPEGDDLVTSFDTGAVGVFDPEGITLDAATGHILIVGKPQERVVRLTANGTLVHEIDIAAAGARKPAGLTLAPGSLDPTIDSLFCVDRGRDTGPSVENDGKLYEFLIPGLTPGNDPPEVAAGDDQTISIADALFLDGTVTDDGLPGSPGQVTVSWSKISGSGDVVFADGSLEDTTATFSAPDLYVLALSASDGELQASDEVLILVTTVGGGLTQNIRIDSSPDDAEESSTGTVSIGSADLELVEERSTQTVGLRFRNVNVPPGATVLAADLQFQADEGDTEVTSLLIEGEATDNPLPFSSSPFDISSRPRTTAAVSWSPPAWNVVGEAGPAQRTPDLSAILQELVLRPDWSAGNGVVILISGSGKRVAEAFDGVEEAAPLLHVEYSQVDHDPPTAEDDSDATAEDTPIALDVAANDFDPEGNLDPASTNVTCGGCSQPTHGSLDNPGDGTFGYTPELNFNGADSFVYQICDAETIPLCDTATVFLTVTPVNDPPVAADDLTSTAEDTTLTVDVVSNDTDPEENLDPTSATSTCAGCSLPGYGTLEDLGTGSFTYSPDPDYHGPDSFTYQICDAETAPLCDTALVMLTVTPVNDPPDVGDDSFTTPEDTPRTLDVIANDVDPEGNLDPGSARFTCASCSLPAHGTLWDLGNGSFTYSPDPNYYGPDGFTYEVCDAESPSICGLGTVSLSIDPVNDPPLASPDLVSTPQNNAVILAVATNDSDPEGNLNLASTNVACAACSPPTGGELVNHGDGTLTYTPALDYAGPDSFVYEICDGEPQPLCDSASVSLTITAVGAPIASDDSATTPEDISVFIDVAANDIDPEGNLDLASANTACIGCSSPANGALANHGNGSFTYTPGQNYFGADQFIYEICDQESTPLCDTATVFLTISPVNDPPSAGADATGTLEDTPVLIPATDNDTDPEGRLDPTSANTLCATCTAPTHGLVINNANGSFTYQPDVDYAGSDSFIYEVCDAESSPLCATATVAIDITPVNDAPTATDDLASTPQDLSVLVDVAVNDSDPEGGLDTTSANTNCASCAAPTHGQLSNLGNGTFEYSPDPGYSGADGFIYEICDGAAPPLCDTAGAIITVTSTGSPGEQYLVFSGGQYVEIAPSAHLNLEGGAFTLSAWIRPDGWGQKSQGRIVDHGGGGRGSSGWTFHLDNTGTHGYPHALAVQINNDSGLSAVSDPDSIALGVWQHVAVVLDNGTLRFYVDGVERGVHSGVPTPLGRDDVVRIGTRIRDTRRGFLGAIDDVRIWQRALSQQEIVDGMNVQLTGPEPGLVAYYRFNEGGGQTTVDLSGLVHDGQLGSTTDPDSQDPAWVP